MPAGADRRRSGLRPVYLGSSHGARSRGQRRLGGAQQARGSQPVRSRWWRTLFEAAPSWRRQDACPRLVLRPVGCLDRRLCPCAPSDSDLAHRQRRARDAYRAGRAAAILGRFGRGPEDRPPLQRQPRADLQRVPRPGARSRRRLPRNLYRRRGQQGRARRRGPEPALGACLDRRSRVTPDLDRECRASVRRGSDHRRRARGRWWLG